MLSVRNKLSCLIILFGVLLQSCSFGPLYDEEVQKDLGSIFVSTIPNRDGQILRNRLRYLLEGYETSEKSRYNLMIDLTITESNIGINRTGVTVRKNKVALAKLVLKDKRTQETVYTSNVKSQNSYVVRNTQFYSNPITEDYATKQTLELLAQFIQADLAMYFSKNEN